MTAVSTTLKSNEVTPRPLRILYLVDSMRVGGKERQICELLKCLKAVSLESFVVTMGTEQFYIPEVKRLGVPLTYLLRYVRWDPTVFPRLLRILMRIRPHIIYTNSEMAMAYAWPLARLLRIRVVNATIRNAFSGQGPRWEWHKLMLRLADARVANSRAGFESRGLLPASSGNYVIYNGLDMRRFQESPKRLKQAFGFDCGDRKVVGMVAEFSDYKDFPTFIRAAQLVLARRNDVVFVAVGGGKNLENCKALAQTQGHIHFLGERSDVDELVPQMDIGVLCTFTEGLPNSVMEYMAAGKPVIVTDGGGSRELVTDGEHGFLVPTSNPEVVAEKIELLLDDVEKARQMGTQGRARVQELFSLERLAQNSLRMYSDIANVSELLEQA